IYDGYEIPIYYDSMLSKLIVWATNRKYALERMRRALYEYKITGIKTNIDYLRRLMAARDYVKGDYTTHFIEENQDRLLEAPDKTQAEKMALAAAYIDYIVNNNTSQPAATTDQRPISRWRAFAKQKGVLRI
ncbi:MAG: acetyl-CoA carboxylase biotin carboxylase subunit, partial [Prevotella sp.]|nr:acetyl-CoA carboxylase biotin carboxylase subunit [Prevotella sp.]